MVNKQQKQIPRQTNWVGSSTLPEVEQVAGEWKQYLQEVTWVNHWTSGLFSFRAKRPVEVSPSVSRNKL